MATASLDGAIRVWDVRSRQLVQHYPAHTGGVHSLQFHHSGHFLLSASEDSTVKVKKAPLSLLLPSGPSAVPGTHPPLPWAVQPPPRQAESTGR